MVLIAVMRVENKRMRMRWRRKTTTGLEADLFSFYSCKIEAKKRTKRRDGGWRREEVKWLHIREGGRVTDTSALLNTNPLYLSMKVAALGTTHKPSIIHLLSVSASFKQ